MSRRRVIAWVAVFVSGAMAILGFLVFFVALLVELFNTSNVRDIETLSPTMQLGLAGLGLMAIMVTLGFGLIGLLLARQTRRQAPGYGDAYRLMESLQFAQALPVLEQAVQRGRTTPELLMLLASAYIHTGQLAKAQATADQAVALYPQDPSAYITLAHGYRMQASYEEAARALQRAVELNPEQPVIWAELGFLYLLTGEENAALNALERAIEDGLPPMYAVRVWYHLARLYEVRGNLTQVKRAGQQIVEVQDGLEAWRPAVASMDGTVYGSQLRYELDSIQHMLQKLSSASPG